MNRRKLENRIKESYKNIAPDITESILLDCDTKKGQIIVMEEKKKRKSFIKYAMSMAAVFMLVIGGFSVSNVYKTNNAVESVIMLDVNPSIEIQVNKSEKVLGVTPLNDDAKIVVGDMDFAGSKLDVTVNALIGSMLRNGYISDIANSILVSVDSNDKTTGEKMQAKLMSEIDSILADGNVDGAVLGQTVSKDNDIQKLAEQYGITIGKAKLIKQITTQNTFYSFEDLVSLSINELNLISESGSTKLENIDSIGTASSSAYVGEKTAKDAAYAHADIKEADVVKVKCELDWEDGAMVYEIDFDTKDFEYEYEIDAKTGKVVKFEKEESDEEYVPLNPANNQTTSNEYISKDAAIAAAIKHAGVSKDSVYDYSCELDHEHGMVIYEIEFKADGYECDYDINALTGDVVRYEREIDDDAKHTSTKKSTSEKADINEEEAKSAVIKHSGVKENDMYDFSCKLDHEDGNLVYEIEFKANGYEYDYELNAIDGTIIKSEKESD